MNNAWLAGFFDGEGYVGAEIRGDRRGVSIRLAFTQRDPAVLLLIQEAFPTTQLWKNPSGAYALWYRRRSSIGDLIDAMLPHAIVKAPALTLARQFLATSDRDERLRLALGIALATADRLTIVIATHMTRIPHTTTRRQQHGHNDRDAARLLSVPRRL